MQLETLLRNTSEITGLAQNSQLVKPGYLFFACKGKTFDGRLYIDEAIKRGAKVVIADSEGITQSEEKRGGVPIYYVAHLSDQLNEWAAQFYHHPAQKLKILGITGTNGKTSCSHFIAQALQAVHQKCGIIGTLGSGFLGSLQNTLMTTPDTVTLQKVFYDFVSAQAGYAAMEVSSHSLEQKRIQGLTFEVGIFTNLTQDHLDYHGSMEAYGQAKKKFFTDYEMHHAVINIDDAFGQSLTALPLQHKITYSTRNPKADIFADQIYFDISGVKALIKTPWGEGTIQAPLVGEFNLSNVLAIVGAVGALGFSFDEIRAGLSHLTPVPGRMQMLGGNDKPTVIIDYAHTPDALEKTLRALRHHCQGKLYCVFGCGGDRDRGKRPLMGAIAEQFADKIVITSDNPRHENPGLIIQEIVAGLKMPKNAHIEEDRSKAIQDIIQWAKAGDYILVAGKGAETYQQIGDELKPFSDSEAVNKCLAD